MTTSRHASRTWDRAHAGTAEGLSHAGIAEVGEGIRRRRISPQALVQAALARIDRLDRQLNAFITVLADRALEQAKAAEAELDAGHWRGPLHGIPVGIKDMFDTAGIRTTAAFEHFRDRVPARDALAVRRLEDAGAVVIGKTNMHRLAMGTTSVDSWFGPVHNPWNPAYIAGGSSGGSAAAVAAGLCFATLDTDAIGSCRLPASCCGVTGFKGTYGLVSNEGVLAGEPVDAPILWLAHAAVTTRSAADAALMLSILSEPDAGAKPGDLAALERGARPRIGAVTNFSAGEQVTAAFDAALDVLRKLGAVRDAAAPFDNPGFDVRHIEADRRTIAGSLFADIDVLALPTTAATTPTIEDVGADPQALSAQNTMFANYYGLPAISVPCGFDRDGLPLGLQIVGKPGDDRTVLRVAHLYQKATTWSRTPPVN
jgi:aspartyl-tRNA(Asn)/glutamyl-tRNA(Gln) amidotransferase subunit A